MRNVSDDICTKNQNISVHSFYFLVLNHAVFQIKWKNTVEPDRPQMTA